MYCLLNVNIYSELKTFLYLYTQTLNKTLPAKFLKAGDIITLILERDNPKTTIDLKSF